MALYHLNEVSGGMLLAGAADGAVRIWRNFPYRAAQRLATAWRVGAAVHATYCGLMPLGEPAEACSKTVCMRHNRRAPRQRPASLTPPSEDYRAKHWILNCQRRVCGGGICVTESCKHLCY